MKIIKFILAWPASEILYWIGDAFSRLIDLYIWIGEKIWNFDQSKNNKIVDTLYTIYSKCLQASWQTNNWGKTNQWKKPFTE